MNFFLVYLWLRFDYDHAVLMLRDAELEYRGGGEAAQLPFGARFIARLFFSGAPSLAVPCPRTLPATIGRWLLCGAASVLPALALATTTPPVIAVTSWAPAGHVLHEAQRQWCAVLEQVASAAVRCVVLQEPVASAADTLEAVVAGRADLGIVVHGHHPARFVSTRVGELPGGADDAESASVALDRLYRQRLATLGEHRPLRVLAVFAHGPGLLFGTGGPPPAAAALTGLRVRTGGGIAQQVATEAGADVLELPPVAIRTAIQDGRLDALMETPESLERFGVTEFVSWWAAPAGGFFNGSFAFVINPESWKRLPPAARAALQRLEGEPTARLFGRIWDKADRTVLARLQARGIPQVPLAAALATELQRLERLLGDEWVAVMRARSLREPEAVLRQWRAGTRRRRAAPAKRIAASGRAPEGTASRNTSRSCAVRANRRGIMRVRGKVSARRTADTLRATEIPG